MHVHCADCDHTFLLSPDGATASAACPSCGGKRLERDQPSPTNSDGDLRNMVDPGIGLDQGGNPHQEGIWAQTDGGWQNWMKRDENYASVRVAEDFGGGNFDFGGDWDFTPKVTTHKFIVDQNGKVFSGPEPTTHEEIADRYGLHRQNFPKGMSLGMLHDTGETGWLQHETQHSPEALASMLYGHFGQPVTIDPNLRPTTNEERFGISPGYQSDQPYREIDRLYGPASPRTYGTPRDSEGLVRGGRALNMDPYLPWTHVAADFPEEAPIEQQQAPAPQQPAQQQAAPGSAQVTPGPIGIHAGTLRLLQFLDAQVNGQSARQSFGELFQTYGNPQSPQFRQPVTVTVPNQAYLQAATQAIESSADPTKTPPAFKELAMQIAAGQIAPPPGVDPAKIKVGHTKIAGPAAAILPALGEIGVGGAVAGLARGALLGTGSHMIQGLMGGGSEAGAAGGGASIPPPRDPSLLASIHEADLETPHSNPGFFHDDPEAIDQREFQDQSTSPNFYNPTVDGEAGGSAMGEDPVRDNAGFGPNSAGLERAKILAPLLLHYYYSDESGANDPLIRELHEQLEAENPGYLDRADDEALQKILKQLRQPDAIHAKTAAPGIGYPAMTGVLNAPQNNAQNIPQQAVPGPLPQTTQQASCPFCGSPVTADGSCPTCGAKTNPMGGSLPPGTNPTAMPYGGNPAGIPRAAASHQGPVTDEQKSAVAELLIETGRAGEVPVMLKQPWDYAEEMAQVAHRLNQPPNVDPDDPQPPQPAQEVAPPGATMPVPNPADPTQQMAAAVRHVATPHNGAPRCPKCGSATTGFSHNNAGKVSANCHSCGNVWEVSDADVARTAAEPAYNPPNPEAIPAADHTQRDDDYGDQDSSHTWQTDDGQPLQVGAEYEMHSPGYAIPDIVRVEAVKPDSIEVSTIGEYSNTDPDPQTGDSQEPLAYKHEITKEEADLEGLTFVPSDGDSNAGEQNLDQYADSSQAPVNTEPTPRPTSSVKEAEEEPERELRDDMCPVCASQHIASELSSPTTSFHECYRCGNSWETKEEDYVDQNTANRKWIMDDSGPGGDDFFAEMDRHKAMRESGNSRSLSDIAARDTRLQEIKERLDAAHEERTAGRKFTPREQRELIEERGHARNADKLNLAGTHYEIRPDLEAKANGMNVPDEHMFMGV
jgi:DNA-directed RNA polymerase subunit RPC12/RpoP